LDQAVLETDDFRIAPERALKRARHLQLAFAEEMPTLAPVHLEPHAGSTSSGRLADGAVSFTAASSSGYSTARPEAPPRRATSSSAPTSRSGQPSSR
jgi:hypothetical protein